MKIHVHVDVKILIEWLDRDKRRKSEAIFELGLPFGCCCLGPEILQFQLSLLGLQKSILCMSSMHTHLPIRFKESKTTLAHGANKEVHVPILLVH